MAENDEQRGSDALTWVPVDAALLVAKTRAILADATARAGASRAGGSVGDSQHGTPTREKAEGPPRGQLRPDDDARGPRASTQQRQGERALFRTEAGAAPGGGARMAAQGVPPHGQWLAGARGKGRLIRWGMGGAAGPWEGALKGSEPVVSGVVTGAEITYIASENLYCYMNNRIKDM